MTSRANLYIDQGIDFLMDLDVFSDDGETTIDISGHTFTGSARKVYSSNKAFDFTTELVANTAGKLEITLASNTSIDIEPGKYQYDIIMTTQASIKIKLLEGLVFVIPTMSGD